MAGPHACSVSAEGNHLERMAVFIGASNNHSQRMAAKGSVRFHEIVSFQGREGVLKTHLSFLDHTIRRSGSAFVSCYSLKPGTLAGGFGQATAGLEFRQEAIHFAVPVEAREAIAHVVIEQVDFGGGDGFTVMHAVLQAIERRAF